MAIRRGAQTGEFSTSTFGEITTSTHKRFWTAFLRKPSRRGLRGVKLVISDAH